MDNPADALNAADELQKDTGTDWFVVKAQIHAGGRGENYHRDRLPRSCNCERKGEVEDKVKGILGGHLVTANI